MTYFDEAHSLSGMAHQPIRITPHPHTDKEPCPGGCEDIVEVENSMCSVTKLIVALEARVKESDERSLRTDVRVDEGYLRMGRMEAMLSATDTKINTNSAETSEILEIMKEGKAFFRFASKAGDVLKWTLGIATAVLAFWVAVKGLTK